MVLINVRDIVVSVMRKYVLVPHFAGDRVLRSVLRNQAGPDVAFHFEIARGRGAHGKRMTLIATAYMPYGRAPNDVVRNNELTGDD